MLERTKKSFLTALWILIITFPLMGLKTVFTGEQAEVGIRADAFYLAGVVFLCGMMWSMKGLIGRGIAFAVPPAKSCTGAIKTSVMKVPVWCWQVGILAMLCAFPFMGSEAELNKYFSFLIETLIYVSLALGLNIMVGMVGLLVLGYAAFFGIGAYTYAILSLNFHVPFWPSLFIGGAIAGVIGILLGIPSIRLRGDYLAIVTLGFGEIVRFVLKNEAAVTGGEQGLPNQHIPGAIAAPSLGFMVLDREIHYYYIAIVIMVLVVFVVHRLNNSRTGRAWIAIREDETAAMSMGINTFRMKILAFAISAFIAGFVGVFYAARMNFVNPEAFRFEYSVLILSMVILGGMGSVPGVILGAVILQVIPWLMRDMMPNLLREYFPSAANVAGTLTDFRLLIFGGIMVIMMIFRPQGIIGNARRKIELGVEEERD
ncbi:MAG: branched-chain amino acid ABC transporter permease [Planctomycetes bacterium]|nr:branched-chain amino acid ABC transporter permease [Planctomycetota bacterium]